MPTITTNLEHLDLQEANRRAQEVMFLLTKLPARMQPVFTAWLQAITQGGIQDCSQTGLATWVGSLNPEQAEAQQSLMVMEIAWLEYLSREFMSLSAEEAQ